MVEGGLLGRTHALQLRVTIHLCREFHQGGEHIVGDHVAVVELTML